MVRTVPAAKYTSPNYIVAYFSICVLCRYHFRYGPNKAYVKGVYNSDDDYFADIAKAYQTELQILYDAGLRNAQGKF